MDVQYYTDRSITDKEYLTLKEESAKFVVKCKEISKKMNKETIEALQKCIVRPVAPAKKHELSLLHDRPKSLIPQTSIK